jgi:hypothetical protein
MRMHLADELPYAAARLPHENCVARRHKEWECVGTRVLCASGRRTATYGIERTHLLSYS